VSATPTPSRETDDLRAAASVCDFLSGLLLHEPTPEQLADLGKGEQGRHLLALGCDLLADLEGLSPEEQAEALAVEYCRLYVGPGPHLSPHEAVVRGEGRHWGEHTVSVNNAYLQASFEMTAEVREMPDHIGVEFAFLAVLYERQAALNRNSSFDEAAAVRDAREKFIAEHLSQWVADFAKQTAHRSTLAFYRTLAELAAEWIAQEVKGALAESANE
jgi:TorA maturation chaperone TorD